MALMKLFMSAAILAAAAPCAAAGPGTMSGAIISLSQAGADAASRQSDRSDERIRGAVYVSATSGMSQMDGAGLSQRGKQRLAAITNGGYAEAALLMGAGLLSPIAQLELPACTDEDDQPGFDCRILSNGQKAGARGDGMQMPRPIAPPGPRP